MPAPGPSAPLKIAILSPVWFPVPPTGYGGIELIVALLAEGLVEAGHEVTLFASGDSETIAELDAVFEEAPSALIGQTFWELDHALGCFQRHAEFDLIHDHTGLLGLALGALLPTPLVHTVHGPLTGRPGELYERVARFARRPCLVSLSLAQRRPRPQLPWLANVPNAIDFTRYPLEPRDGEYLVWLGRMTPDKGADRAIEIARRLGLPLKLAGKNAEPAERAWYAEHVEPKLGGEIEFIGEVGHDEKVELLRNARAMLFPIDWEEPFGLVMIEAAACGTPVLASPRGSVPEVIEDGVTGIIVDEWERAEEALERADRLDPHAMRASVERRFSPAGMVADYVAAYESLLAHELPTVGSRR